MKKRVICTLLSISAIFLLAACGSADPSAVDSTASETSLTESDSSETTEASENSQGAEAESTDSKETSPHPVTDQIFAQTDTVVRDPSDLTDVQQWLSYEIDFVSDTDYEDPVYTVDMDVVFTNNTTKSSFTIPAFWDGDTTWTVRFVLPETGDWSYETLCSDESNTGLQGQTGSLTCNPYSGDLDIYKHGFVKTEEGTRYFMYDDGTPFFYLADTHWTLPIEEIDGIGDISQEIADMYGITSQFKYIMDFRTEQGYTVIQSQQLGWYTGITGNSWMGDVSGSIFNYGVNDAMLEKFQQLDEYFAYIAEKGLVHSHTQFAYPEELIETYMDGYISEEQIDKLCRYWVARYSAYPVIWATAQEGDDDYYAYYGCTSENNPWLLVMNDIAAYDPYDHPSTCHQENTNNTRVKTSVFGTHESHDFYAAQYSSELSNNAQLDWTMLKEYYDNPGSKPVVNYEARYDHFWAGTFCTRAQGWVAYLNGNAGFGYGVQPIWSIVWAAYGEQTTSNDEVEKYERGIDWVEGLYSDAGRQLSYMKDFLTQYEWWNLVPSFNESEYYYTFNKGYSVATIENKLYIGYFYSTKDTAGSFGTFTGMENADYEYYWFNCQTGERTETQTVTITNNSLDVPAKPDSGDWALAMELVE